MSVDAVLIAGPTASGKSVAGLTLAARLGGVVINADSMQVYREARILTARPSDEDEARVPHRLYGHVGVSEPYSVARYLADAGRALASARETKRLPIFVGGTGLYFQSLLQGLADIPTVPAKIRMAARARREEIGADAFHAELAVRDPRSAARLHASDSLRVLRAYEVFEATTRPLSEWHEAAPVPGPLAGLKLARFVLAPSRPELHRRINERFEAMLQRGAVEEAACLEGLDPVSPAAKILGLRELWAVRRGAIILEEARTVAQASTRQYAKRQLTWFRHRMADWRWIVPDAESNFITEMLPRVT